MGHPDLNFHKNAMIARGYEDAANRIQELFLAGRREEAIDAVPDEFVDEGALVGPRERITSRFVEWRDCGITGLTVRSDREDVIELMAHIADIEPLA
jgi:hypothetical protein